jgi:hypothetical protein
MEKILVILNANKPDTHLIDFGIKVASMAESKLTGLFIENLYFEYIPANDIEPASFFETMPEKVKPIVATDTDQAIRIFKDECLSKRIASEVYVIKGEPIQEVIYESRFADLLIVDPEMSFYETEEELPTHFMKEILANAECPVIAAPGKLPEIEDIVFCYDGSASSVFAIKQFTYILPELKNKNVTLLEVNRNGYVDKDEKHIRMMAWIRAHYPSAYYHTLKGDVKDVLVQYLQTRKNAIAVMGAYGRSMISKFIKKSNADVLMSKLDLPIFICHR